MLRFFTLKNMMEDFRTSSILMKYLYAWNLCFQAYKYDGWNGMDGIENADPRQVDFLHRGTKNSLKNPFS